MKAFYVIMNKVIEVEQTTLKFKLTISSSRGIHNCLTLSKNNFKKENR